jgi:hypothetical protein
MADELAAKVVRIFADPNLLPTGQVEARTTVEYMVGDHGPFRLRLADAEFSAERVRVEMEKKATEIRKIVTGK